MIRTFIPPKEYIQKDFDDFKVFLAGTIDSGNSVDWQTSVIKRFISRYPVENITVFNPRRNPWPKDAGIDIQIEQIEWEHRHLDDADLIIMNILPDSLSPISLMEIGMYAQSGKLIVFCTPDYYRYTNIMCVCEKYHIPLYNTNDIDDIVLEIHNMSEGYY